MKSLIPFYVPFINCPSCRLSLTITPTCLRLRLSHNICLWLQIYFSVTFTGNNDPVLNGMKGIFLKNILYIFIWFKNNVFSLRKGRDITSIHQSNYDKTSMDTCNKPCSSNIHLPANQKAAFSVPVVLWYEEWNMSLIPHTCIKWQNIAWHEIRDGPLIKGDEYIFAHLTLI